MDIHKTLNPFYNEMKMPNFTGTVADSVPLTKLHTEQMFVLVSMTELAEF